jgi:hypothetical protein
MDRTRTARASVSGQAALEAFPVIAQANDIENALSPELASAVEQATARLQQELGGRLPEATIISHVCAALDELRDARVKTYVPVLTYRIARERLRLLLDTPS